MPRLTKIRITGNKYDGFKKRHDDSIFDLAPDGKGDHALFTLQNGSGKGVMLQLISQIMLPGTAWGSNNGNKLEGMFYNRYNVFNPYTFHVGLEWSLDDNPEERLLAGICVSARKQKNLDDSEGKVGLKYFLYTHEYKAGSNFGLEKLPLYSNGKPVPYKQFEEFIDDNRQDFRKYTKTAVSSLNSDYYQYLASHGIYRSEWEIMKTINRSEGGLDKYFSRARDNQALFDKMIIPAVSESISHRSEENGKSLLNMFVDNIKIAENLPELISRTQDIKQLIKMVEPLMLDAEHGVKLRETRESVRNRGNNILSALNNRKSWLQNELERSQTEKEKTAEKIDELHYQKQNLKYARKVRELQEMEDEISVLKEKRDDLQKKQGRFQEQEKELKLNLLYLSWQKERQKYEQTAERINELKKSLGLDDLRQKIKDVKVKLENNWPGLKEKWEESSKNVSGYFKHLNVEEKRLRQEKEDLENKIHDHERKIDRFEERQQRLNEWKQELSARFNLLQLDSPSYLEEQLSKELEAEKKKVSDLKEKIETKSEEIESVKDEINEQEVKLAGLKSKEEAGAEKYEARQKEEKEVYAGLAKLLQLDRFKEVYSPDWLSEKQLKLQELLTEKENRLQDLQNKEYELELDLALNKEDYWIANHNQKKLYRAISNLDIKVYYGSDFLINLAEDREEVLNRYPLLPYGLVLMYEGDWKQVKNNLQQEEIFRSPVPIFINYQLGAEEVETSFKLVHGRETEFISRPGSFREWYGDLETKAGEIEKTVATVKTKIKNIRQLNYKIKQLLDKKSSRELEKELNQVREDIEQVRETIDKKKKKIEQLKQEQKELKTALEKSRTRVENLAEDYREIKEFAAETVAVKKCRPEIGKIKESRDNLKEKLAENSSEREENTRLRLKLESEYDNWKKDLKRFLAEIRELLPDVEFDERESDEQYYSYPELYDYRESRVNYFYQQYLDLEKEEESRSTEITFLKKDLKRFREQILELEDKLEELDPDWNDYTFEGLKRKELEIKLEQTENKLKQVEAKFSGCRDDIKVLSARMEMKKEEIDELFVEIKDRFNKTAQSWPELDLKEKELKVKENLVDSREYLEKLKDMVGEYEDKLKQINTLIYRLDLYQLESEKGEMNSLLKENIEQKPEEVVEDWIDDYKEVENKLDSLNKKSENDFYKFKGNVNELVENKILKNKIQEKIIQDFRSDDYSYNYDLLNTFREYLRNELNKLDDDKSEAEQARNQWAERSAMHIMRVINSLKEMINNMVYHNQREYAFPLVRLKRSDLLPESKEEIIPELKEYFIEVIDKFKHKDIRVNDLTDTQLREFTGDAALFSRAVRGRYPVLQVYKMTEKNEFLRARPRDYYYADWEAVIQGKGDSPEGSGGQSLSINAFMMMMLLNYKKQRLDQSNPWTLLLLDNPFGQASAVHVLDPVFKIADKLNFQLVAFSAPEIIKTEISERFPVFWALEIADDEQGRGVVDGQVIYGERLRTAQ